MFLKGRHLIDVLPVDGFTSPWEFLSSCRKAPSRPFGVKVLLLDFRFTRLRLFKQLTAALRVDFAFSPST